MTGFDLHAERNRLKQLTDDGDTRLFENRDDVPCPACGQPFERVFSTRRESVSFPETDGSRFCLVREPDVVHLFRH